MQEAEVEQRFKEYLESQGWEASLNNPHRIDWLRRTLRRWVAQALVDEGKVPGVFTEESAETRRLKRKNAELRRANEILKTA